MATYTSGNQTREMLIASAGELAARDGFANVSIRAVATRAGQNIGSIHYHFKTKLELFKAVIRAATRSHREHPIQSILAKFENRLHLPKVQAEAIRAIVHQSMLTLFNPEKPWWHSRVIYQAMQRQDELWDLLNQEVVEPDITLVRKLFKTILPDLSDEETFLHTMLMKTPIIFHADNADSILTFLQRKSYSESYLAKMENMIVLQTQLLLGLPIDNQLYTRTEQ